MYWKKLQGRKKGAEIDGSYVGVALCWMRLSSLHYQVFSTCHMYHGGSHSLNMGITCTPLMDYHLGVQIKRQAGISNRWISILKPEMNVPSASCHYQKLVKIVLRIG